MLETFEDRVSRFDQETRLSSICKNSKGFRGNDLFLEGTVITPMVHHGKRYNLRNADFVLPRFQTVSYGKHSLRFLGAQLWAK